MSLRVHHINCGTMCPACQRLINDRAGSWSEPGRLVCHCLLIETADSLVLVDTGLGQQDIAEPDRRLGGAFRKVFKPRLDPQETAITQIRGLGFDPRDVRHIALTHVDLDHAGGIADFPEAQVHVLKPELQQLQQPGWRERNRFRPAQFEHQPNWVTHAPEGERWFGFEGIRAIPGVGDDILLIPLIGHTKGHTGVAVRQGNKWLLHSGDAYYHRSQLTDQPRTPHGLMALEAGVQSIRQSRLHNQARLRELAQQHSAEVEIFCSHDPVEFSRYAGLPG